MTFSRDMIDEEREKNRVYQQIRRAEGYGVEATLTADEWINTIVLFQGLCAYCKKVPFDVLDHLYPIISGGGTTQQNCVPACRSCNSCKCAKIGDDVSSASSLIEAAEKTFASLHANPDVFNFINKEDIASETTRYPKEVREALRKYAKEDHRSFNGEVIHVLQDYITEREKRNKEDAPT